MAEDLKQQASELYKERTKKDGLLTSESLSIKKLLYIFIALLIFFAVVIQIFGGFKKRPNPIVAANNPNPAPAIMEAPPPELLEPNDPEAPTEVPLSESLPSTSAPAPSPPPSTRSTSSAENALPRVEKKLQPQKLAAPPEIPSSRDEPQTTVGAATNRSVLRKPEKEDSERVAIEEAPTTDPREARVSAEEEARRNLAREIVVEKSSSLATLLTTPNQGEEYSGWTAELFSEDVYLVTFTFAKKASSSTLQYVWRVKLTDRTITPLSYYARKLR